MLALAGVAQWIERRPVNQTVAGSIPGQGTCLDCGPGLRADQCIFHTSSYTGVSLPVFLPPFPSL